MADLHARLLAELGKPYEVWAPSAPAEVLGKIRLALRAVVELHAPVVFWRPYAGEPPRCVICPNPLDEGERTPWPCSTVQTIARELGVEHG